MTDLDSRTPTQEERIMAGLSHISVLLPLMGVIVPIVVWVTQKDKSQHVAFQALQAMAYQLTMVVAYFLGMGCYFLTFLATFLLLPALSSTNSSLGLPVFLPLLAMAAVFIGGFVFIVYGVIGAIMVIQGKPFRYIIIGKWVEHFIQQKLEGEKIQ